jgi:hypothetical protein
MLTPFDNSLEIPAKLFVLQASINSVFPFLDILPLNVIYVYLSNILL